MRIAVATLVALAVGLGVHAIAHAQPAGGSALVVPAPGAGSGAAPAGGSGTAPIRIDLQPGQPIQVPVRPGAVGQPGGPGGPPIVVRGGQGQPLPGAGPTAPAGAPAADEPYRPAGHGDITAGTAKDKPLLAIAFWLFALITIGGAVFVVTRRNLISAVMGMVGTFFGVAATYMMLFASFLAVVQMLVYAGAIMVLFVFVIMILNRPEDEPFGGAGAGLLGKGLAGAGIAYLIYRFVFLLWSVVPVKTAGPMPAPLEDHIGAIRDPVFYPWGSTKAIGHALFTDGLFPFEAISILLLVAVVGAIAIARPLKDDEGEPPAVAEGDA